MIFTGKRSFQHNSVFMKCCIRDSIEEITTRTQLRKELQFLTSERGEKGYRLIKQGREIVGIEFFYRWHEPRSWTNEMTAAAT